MVAIRFERDERIQKKMVSFRFKAKNFFVELLIFSSSAVNTKHICTQILIILSSRKHFFFYLQHEQNMLFTVRRN